MQLPQYLSYLIFIFCSFGFDWYLDRFRAHHCVPVLSSSELIVPFPATFPLNQPPRLPTSSRYSYSPTTSNCLSLSTASLLEPRAMNRIQRSRPSAKARCELEQEEKEAKLAESKTLIIDQANFKGSSDREKKFLNFNTKTPGWLPPHIIVGCDASPQTAWKSPGEYHLEIRASRTLVETDNPYDPNRLQGNPPKLRGRKSNNPPVEIPPAEPPPLGMSRVFFLVRKSIPRESWNVEWYNDVNSGMAATLHMATEMGDIHVHSIYNPNQPGQTINIPEMIDKTTVSGADIVMGDFNLHHPSWSGPLFRGDPTKVLLPARQLHDGMANADMKLQTIPGTGTFVSGQGKDAIRSCIDLTFVSPSLQNCVKSCQVYERSPWPQSDHCPIRTTLEIKPFQDRTLRYLFHGADEKLFNDVLAADLPPLDKVKGIELNERGVESLTNEIIKCLQNAVDTAVPTLLVNRPPSTNPMDPKTRQFLDGDGIPSSQAEPESPLPTVGLNDGVISEPPRITPAAILYTNLASPSSNMPALLDGSGACHASEEEKQQHLLEALWKGMNEDEIKNMTTVPFPTIDPEHTVFEMDMTLDEKETRRLINEVRRRKAPGLDMIPGEALKLARDTLVPYLTILFNACIKLGYFPACFKTALVCIIPKPDKASYASAKSWRPIALLCSLGKLFEKFLANCLKKVTIDNFLLPTSQYGAPGRSTTECIKTLLQTIHRTWSRKKTRLLRKQWLKVTKMGLDIASAFDRINRALILQALADKGLPEPFLRMIQSFLSDRYTILKLPQSTSASTRVNIGIPQGSPLSPLLFLFFVAPFLEQLKKDAVLGVKLIPFSYVDDTYVVVLSQSYGDNCFALEQVHNTIMRWANETGTEFSPQKYSNTHFKNPRDKSPDCQLLPNIAGVAGNLACFKDQKVKVLGVTLDPQLGFKAHIDDIENKVDKKLRHLRFIARRKTGLTLQGAKEFYKGSILPISTYAYEAWFLFSLKQRLLYSLKQ
ncbi:unnamed protein product [Fusarium langsethiae]|nr:unnamed protein product [Fusarium langsethiae]